MKNENDYLVDLEKESLPWLSPHKYHKQNHRTYFKVIFGTVRMRTAITTLLTIYDDKRPDKPNGKGESIIASAIVDERGYLINSTAISISSFAWGLHLAMKKKLDKLSAWPEIESRLQIKAEEILRPKDKDGQELPVSLTVIEKTIKMLIKEMDLDESFLNPAPSIVACFQHNSNDDPPESALINSFYIKDLISAARLYREGHATKNLKKYLGDVSTGAKKNILKDLTVLENAICPAMIPPGRWPGPGRHPLVLLQQAAVNLSFSELKGEGILAVNGPPGTGKTTLLRDIIAGILVQRAEVLCNFSNPKNAFEDSGEKLVLTNSKLTLYELDDSLKGFEIIIASSNNKAVENVSAELPGRKAIAEDIKEIDYFTELSNSLLGKESWGLIAAVLGNAKNRNKFKTDFWWQKDVGMGEYLGRLLNIDEKILTNNWESAKKDFQKALAFSKNMLKDREKERNQMLSSPKEGLQKLKNKYAIVEEDCRNAEKEIQKCRRQYNKIRKDGESISRELAYHSSTKPSTFFGIGSKKLTAWKEQQEYLLSMQQNMQNDLYHIDQKIKKFENDLSRLNRKLKQLEKEISEIQEEQKKNKARVASKAHSHSIDEHFWKMSHEQKQVVSPWCSMEDQLLRDEVFLAALRLHKAFIEAAARPIKHNLGALMYIFAKGRLPDEEQETLLSHLWSTLFMVVPCISTTFASVERMIGNLYTNSLGWLLIDEAGQALPQAAVGAMLRTQKIVVVGDPVQIQPVVTLPEELTKNICIQFDVDPDKYNAPSASVQTLADAATPYFAEFEGIKGNREVGLPLLVHRRCDEPMFSISNTIAYSNLMVQAKQKKQSKIRQKISPSTWFHISGSGEDKWCPQEGQKVLDLLTQMQQADINPDIYIVTPFVIVAQNLRKIIKTSGIISFWVSDENEVNDWLQERIGTVHTVQGREAEAVILVLGAPLGEQQVSRNWAGSSPNMLNVAVTRAKEILYVVGNFHLWKNTGVFHQLASSLPIKDE